MAELSKKRHLSKMQQKIFDYLVTQIQKQGYPPSVREIGTAVGLRSPSTVHFHLKKLEENGYIAKNAGKGRAITILKYAETVQNRVPILGRVAAGTPILAEEYIEDYLTFETNGQEGELFALRVWGDSMKNAGILPEDMVIVHCQPSAENGEIVVALFKDEATVKRLFVQDGQVWLLPENENYSPIHGEDAQILGKVAAVLRQY